MAQRLTRVTEIVSEEKEDELVALALKNGVEKLVMRPHETHL